MASILPTAVEDGRKDATSAPRAGGSAEAKR